MNDMVSFYFRITISSKKINMEKKIIKVVVFRFFHPLFISPNVVAESQMLLAMRRAVFLPHRPWKISCRNVQSFSFFCDYIYEKMRE